jgi:hypothetical protein
MGLEALSHLDPIGTSWEELGREKATSPENLHPLVPGIGRFQRRRKRFIFRFLS